MLLHEDLSSTGVCADSDLPFKHQRTLFGGEACLQKRPENYTKMVQESAMICFDITLYKHISYAHLNLEEPAKYSLTLALCSENLEIT